MRYEVYYRTAGDGRAPGAVRLPGRDYERGPVIDACGECLHNRTERCAAPTCARRRIGAFYCALHMSRSVPCEHIRFPVDAQIELARPPRAVARVEDAGDDEESDDASDGEIDDEAAADESDEAERVAVDVGDVLVSADGSAYILTPEMAWALTAATIKPKTARDEVHAARPAQTAVR